MESLEHISRRYLEPLRSGNFVGLLDMQTVDEIFLMIPNMQLLHERFLEKLQLRLNTWNEAESQVGVAFIETVSLAAKLIWFVFCLLKNSFCLIVLRVGRL